MIVRKKNNTPLIYFDHRKFASIKLQNILRIIEKIILFVKNLVYRNTQKSCISRQNWDNTYIFQNEYSFKK